MASMGFGRADMSASNPADACKKNCLNFLVEFILLFLSYMWEETASHTCPIKMQRAQIKRNVLNIFLFKRTTKWLMMIPIAEYVLLYSFSLYNLLVLSLRYDSVYFVFFFHFQPPLLFFVNSYLFVPLIPRVLNKLRRQKTTTVRTCVLL